MNKHPGNKGGVYSWISQREALGPWLWRCKSLFHAAVLYLNLLSVTCWRAVCRLQIIGTRCEESFSHRLKALKSVSFRLLTAADALMRFILQLKQHLSWKMCVVTLERITVRVLFCFMLRLVLVGVEAGGWRRGAVLNPFQLPYNNNAPVKLCWIAAGMHADTRGRWTAQQPG